MCGIAGYWAGSATLQELPDLDAALDRLAHRGPDDKGIERRAGPWGEIALGHTRLSIIDLSAAGHQPMHTTDRQAAIVFNGEIYNYRELRSELVREGHSFTSESDTEVLLHAWRHWGEDCLRRLIGMFAFVIADFEGRTLTLVRDPFGIKPLYFAKTSWGLCFASELPACVALRSEGAALDHQRAHDYLVHGDYDSNERTFVEGIRQLAPGTLQVLDLASGRLLEARRWWSPDVRMLPKPRFDDAADQLRQMFLDSVRLHLRSDVPLGAALSGGIDSSAVVYAMRHLEPDAPLHTFSFVAHGSPVSEEVWINTANAGVRATAHQVIVEPHEMARDLDDMIVAQGEPFGSTSIYAQYRVFRRARDAGITVTLDGQGADELLGGYFGYPGHRVRSLLDHGRFVAAWSFLRQWSHWPGRQLSDGLHASLGQCMQGPAYEMLRKLKWKKAAVVHPDWLDVDQLREQGVRLAFPRQAPDPCPRGRRLAAELCLSATRRGLPALLRHADRNSMRFSVESRVPFLTPQMASFLFSLPEEFLVSDEGRTKHVFRAAMRGIVPDAILERRDKIGFATPERDWLLALGSRARDWMREAQFVPFLRPDPMIECFDAMMAGRVAFSWQAWRWINFCRWYTQVFQPLSSA
jgi:asparagine synthase (glutamine-hydrolysing)